MFSKNKGNEIVVKVAYVAIDTNAIAILPNNLHLKTDVSVSFINRLNCISSNY